MDVESDEHKEDRYKSVGEQPIKQYNEESSVNNQ